MRVRKLVMSGITLLVVLAFAYTFGQPQKLSVRQGTTSPRAISGVTAQSRLLSDQIDEAVFSPTTDEIIVLTKNLNGKGKRIARCSLKDTNAMKLVFETQSVLEGIAISPEGNQVYTGQWQTGPHALRLDADTGRISKRLLGEVDDFGLQITSDATAVGLSPDGSILVVGTKLVDAEHIAGGHIGGEVIAWDTSTGSLLWRHSTSHTNIIRCIAFSPDGQSVASAGEDALIRIWDVASGELRRTLIGVLWGGVSSMQFSPDGKFLVTGGAGLEEGGRIRIWDLSKGKIADLFSPFQNSSRVHVAFDSIGRLFASAQSTESSNESPAFEVRLWEAHRFAELGVVGKGTGYVRTLQAARSKPAIAVGTSTGELIVYSFDTSTNP